MARVDFCVADMRFYLLSELVGCVMFMAYDCRKREPEENKVGPQRILLSTCLSLKMLISYKLFIRFKEHWLINARKISEKNELDMGSLK